MHSSLHTHTCCVCLCNPLWSYTLRRDCRYIFGNGSFSIIYIYFHTHTYSDFLIWNFKVQEQSGKVLNS
ncbi:hypothetical protein WN944_019948 [Citrus x changshan-huyou]|uniref:Uncharacterized protein n=1 Tax=Citrus x changshan-huyou TaxID=2935761 RepID=A0AAP0LZI9_9ROSI